MVEAVDRLLATEEPESSRLVASGARRRRHHGAHRAPGRRVSPRRHGFTVTSSAASRSAASGCWSPLGRRSNFADLGLDAAGLDADAPNIDVDERMRAGDRMWAIGDVTGHGAFTHMAMYQAGIAIRDILGQDGPPADYRALPRVTFTDPEIGSVGPDRDAGTRRGRDASGSAIAQIPSTRARLDPQGRQRRLHQARRGRRSRRARRRHLGRPGRR